MLRRRSQLPVFTVAASFLVALAGCGGGGGSTGSVVDPMPMPPIDEDTTVALAGVPTNHGLGSMDEFTIQPGASEERGNVELSCPAGGPACVVSVADDRTVQYERTGGMPTVMSALMALAGLPSNHGLSSMDGATIQPGMSEERGNVELSCPAGGSACVVSVADDGTVQYERTGGMPTVMPALTALDRLPSNHGFAPMDELTIQPGASQEQGNLELSCPETGHACVVSVADDGAVRYERTGGMPSVNLLYPFGLTPGQGAPIYAQTSGDTLAALLPSSQNQFPPLSSILQRNNVEPRSSRLVDNVHIASISSDGANGFHVTYVIDGEREQIHFRAEDFGADDCSGCYLVQVEDGVRYVLWSHTDTFARGTDKNSGSSEFRYFDSHGGEFRNERGTPKNRMFIVYGVRTEPGNLPVGAANFVGRFYARTYLVDNPDINRRVDVRGNLDLTADFDASTLEGRIDSTRVRRRDEDGNSLPWESLPDTTHLVIENGQIVGGRFAAGLTGVDSNNAAPLEETFRGYEGAVLGEFYGPAAEEVGGVLNAESEAHGRMMAGWFGGGRLNPRVPEGNLSILSAAVDLDYPGSTTQLTDTDRVTAVASDGSTGIYVTYRIDGADYTVHLTEDDYGTHSANPNGFTKRVGNREYFHYEYTRFSFRQDPQFSYFNVNGWAVVDLTNDDSIARIWRGPVVYGTPTTDLPAGTADYTGRVYADSLPAGDSDLSMRSTYQAELTLTADFDGSSVGGRMDEFRVRAPGQSNYDDISAQIMIENGVITNSQFTADLTGQQDATGFEGDMKGQFFGPGAAEVGGLLKGTNTADNAVVQGWFGGTKQ